ncbi:MAG: RNA polymerase sigma factor, partial [Micromonosporaceae bacterium]
DLDLAEEATAEAFASALAAWRASGVPPNPGGWLQTTARRKAIDRLRRGAIHQRKLAELEHALSQSPPTVDSAIPDERLELIFCCCHPAFAVEAQVALTLRCVAGLTVPEIARAFLVNEQTMAKRLVRAKRKVRDARVPLRVPDREELPHRLPAVLAVVYLIFNEGYAASGDTELVRADLCARAIDLGELLAALMPDQPEVLGLLALMLLHESRRTARTGPDGALVLLADQDRTAWDRTLIGRASRVIQAAWRRPGCGRYVIEASIAGVHASAPRYDDTDWPHIVRLYDLLHRLSPSPVVALNRAAAIGLGEGPAAGLAALDPLAGELADYQYFHSTRADLLRRAGKVEESRTAYRRALELAGNPAERAFLTARLQSMS